VKLFTSSLETDILLRIRGQPKLAGLIVSLRGAYQQSWLSYSIAPPTP